MVGGGGDGEIVVGETKKKSKDGGGEVAAELHRARLRRIGAEERTGAEERLRRKGPTEEEKTGLRRAARGLGRRRRRADLDVGEGSEKREG